MRTLMTRDVWRIDRAGSLRRLKRHTEPLPPPGAGQARVRVEAVGLNFADIFACLGLYSATPRGAFTPGLEFAGVIEEFGAAPERAPIASPTARVGDRVMGLTRFGAYATAVNADVHLLSPVPHGWSMAEAAAFPVQGLTAWYGLVEQARVQDGELVLVHSAAGGVGLFALAILRSLGARIVATVGHDRKRQLLTDRHGLRPDLVIVRDRRRFGDQLDRALAAAGSDGFDVILDAVEGPFFRPAWNRLRPRGRFVLYGASDFMPGGTRALSPRTVLRYVRRPWVDPLSLIAANRTLIGFNLIWLWEQADRLPVALAQLHALSPDAPLVGERFGFDQAPAAMRFLQSGQSTGKVILETTAPARQ